MMVSAAADSLSHKTGEPGRADMELQGSFMLKKINLLIFERKK